MPEPIVTPDSGTVAVLDPPKVEVKEETKVQTLADVEKQYREDYDKKHGRDIVKLFPAAAPKKEEPKTEAKAKTETPAEQAKAETPKPKSGFQRAMTKLNRALGAKDEQIKTLESRLQVLEGGRPKPDAVVVDTPKEPVKPKRADFPDVDKYLEAYDKYSDDIRKFDKEQLTKQTKTEVERINLSDQEAAATERYNRYVTKRDEVAKTIPDWDETIKKSENLEFKAELVGLLIDIGTEDPRIYYDIAKEPKLGKALNKLTKESVATIGTTSDSVSGVVRHLMSNPDDLDKLNSLDGPKAAKFIGIIESKLEAPKPKTEEVAPLPAESASPKPDSKAPVQAEPARRQRPEPPPKVSGSAPPPTDWKEPTEMPLEERERLYREDPRNKRR